MKVLLNGDYTDEVVMRLGEGLMIFKISDEYQDKEGRYILHLVEPQTGTQTRRLKEMFEKPHKGFVLAKGGNH